MTLADSFLAADAVCVSPGSKARLLELCHAGRGDGWPLRVESSEWVPAGFAVLLRNGEVLAVLSLEPGEMRPVP